MDATANQFPSSLSDLCFAQAVLTNKLRRQRPDSDDFKQCQLELQVITGKITTIRRDLGNLDTL
ncbi:hypothetical protein [Hymenobacter crusticola]|uniref:Uncharacterized protein n=1 Tax=Hymenobacter crusticola TaxID=1770526 RepID=A0A243W997_9BACT|nr:hypothetical protein [Hymenobacter crusticola]OUJ71985.1 hypothetical protein BXP70_20455 [Hymenobacter crusticola]